jgi:cytochrome c peroxidase
MIRHLLPVLVLQALAGQSLLPPPRVPAGNPITATKALLGKALFWDEQVSSTRAVACGTCHVLSQGGADPRTPNAVHPGADGRFGTADDGHGSPGDSASDAAGHLVAVPAFGMRPQVTRRRAPSVVNAAYARSLFLDGRADDVFRDPLTGAIVLPTDAALENQIAGPPVHSGEMGHVGRSWADVAADLADLTPLTLASNVPAPLLQFVAGRSYADLFAQAFGSPGVTPVRIVMALATYERTLLSDQSPFDRFLAGLAPLSPGQAAGLAVFRTHCASCHDDLDAATLTAGPRLDAFHAIGVRPATEDPGRAAVTGNLAERGAFRVPGLRNVALRGSYFHDGSQATLGGVVAFYARGGDFADNRDPRISAMAGNLSVVDTIHLLDLLQSLTDPRVAFELPPFDRPTLWSEGADVPYHFGSGTAGTLSRRPRATASGPAMLGNRRFAIGVDRVVPDTMAALVLDPELAQVPWSVAGLSVYLALSPATMVFVPGFTRPGPDGCGHASVLLPLPNEPALAGTLFAQWLALDASGPRGLVGSDALAIPVFAAPGNGGR